MDLTCDERPSDSSFIETVWRNQSDGGAFVSMAGARSGIVLTRFHGKTIVTLRGPESRATKAFAPAGAEFIGIQFTPGTFLPEFPAKRLMDRRDVNLPEASGTSFWLKGGAWQFPDFENVETFVDWLARDGLLAHDTLVDSVLQGHPVNTSLRTVQRRFTQATGLTQGYLRQIERARYAVTLLKQGRSILDTVFEAGYFDQPHLTRSLKHFVGFTPAQLIDENRSVPLSFLYKTAPLLLDYDRAVPVE